MWPLNHIKITACLHSPAFLLQYVVSEGKACYHLKVSVFCAWVSEPSLHFKHYAKKSDTILTELLCL